MSPASGCVTVSRPLDLAEVDRVRTAAVSAIAQAATGSSGAVVLDLSGCDFVDVVGYRLLEDVARTARQYGLGLQVVGASGRVVRVIRTLDAVLAGAVGAHVAQPATT